MAVFRVEKTKDFTVMSNHHLRNTELSLKAKGLLSLKQARSDMKELHNIKANVDYLLDIPASQEQQKDKQKSRQ